MTAKLNLTSCAESRPWGFESWVQVLKDWVHVQFLSVQVWALNIWMQIWLAQVQSTVSLLITWIFLKWWKRFCMKSVEMAGCHSDSFNTAPHIMVYSSSVHTLFIYYWIVHEVQDQTERNVVNVIYDCSMFQSVGSTWSGQLYDVFKFTITAFLMISMMLFLLLQAECPQLTLHHFSPPPV